MKGFPKFSTMVVLIHLAVAWVHGLAHQHLLISLTRNQQLFIILVIVLAPVVALVLSWTRAWRTGALLLFLSMLGSLMFGIVNHYVIASPDHVSHLPAGEWALAFKTTAALLAITEVLGGVVGAAGLRARRA
jgi:hypothetical protein